MYVVQGREKIFLAQWLNLNFEYGMRVKGVDRGKGDKKLQTPFKCNFF
jgi:hypothetical protein